MTRTQRLLPLDLRLEINAVLIKYKNRTLPVYAEAEKIRQRFAQLNIALEDILNRLVEDSGRHQVAVSFNPAEAKSALMDASVVKRTEMMEPNLTLQ